MRALRDFNVPKIITDDVPVFMGLIGDLFPALDVPRKRDMEFERTVKQASMDLLLQPEDNFILKVRAFFNLNVRSPDIKAEIRVTESEKVYRGCKVAWYKCRRG